MTEPLSWPECLALADRHNPTRVEAPNGSEQAVTTEIVPRTRPRGIWSPRGEGWGIPAIVLDTVIATASALVGWAVLNLMDAVIHGLVFAQAGLLP
jgi:hypothetical protein